MNDKDRENLIQIAVPVLWEEISSVLCAKYDRDPNDELAFLFRESPRQAIERYLREVYDSEILSLEIRRLS